MEWTRMQLNHYTPSKVIDTTGEGKKEKKKHDWQQSLGKDEYVQAKQN